MTGQISIVLDTGFKRYFSKIAAKLTGLAPVLAIIF